VVTPWKTVASSPSLKSTKNGSLAAVVPAVASSSMLRSHAPLAGPVPEGSRSVKLRWR